MKCKIKSEQYDVTIQEAHLDVQIGDAAQMEVNQAVSYIQSGEKEITDYVENVSKPALDLHAHQTAEQIVTEQVQPLVSDVTINAAHAQSDAQAAAQSARDAADYAEHARFGMYERTFAASDWQQKDGKYVITYDDARIISAVYRNHQLVTNVDIVSGNNGVSIISDSAFAGFCLVVNRVEQSEWIDIETLLESKQDVISDLDQIRAGSALAGTALQPSDNISELNNDAGYITGISSSDVTSALGYTPQDTLVSGTNIKTINSQSILGSGNIDIQGGTDIEAFTAAEVQTIWNGVL